MFNSGSTFVYYIIVFIFSDQKCMDLSNLNEDDQTFIGGNSHV